MLRLRRRAPRPRSRGGPRGYPEVQGRLLRGADHGRPSRRGGIGGPDAPDVVEVGEDMEVGVGFEVRDGLDRARVAGFIRCYAMKMTPMC